MNRVAMILTALKWWLRMVGPDKMDPLELSAYDAGYCAAGFERNPHSRGTNYHRAWREGSRDRVAELLRLW